MGHVKGNELSIGIFSPQYGSRVDGANKVCNRLGKTALLGSSVDHHLCGCSQYWETASSAHLGRNIELI